MAGDCPKMNEIFSPQGAYLPPVPIQKIFSETAIRARLENEDKKIFRAENWNKELQKDRAFRQAAINETLMPLRRNKITTFFKTKEDELGDAIFQGTIKRTMQDRNLEQEHAIADEVKQIKDEAIAKEKRHLQLHANSKQLQDLERRIQRAYYQKEAVKELAELEKMKEKAKAEHLKEIDKYRDEFKKNEEDILVFEQKQLDAQFNLRKELQEQQRNNELMRQCEYQERLREKLLIDDILRQIYEEDKKLMQEKQGKLASQKQALDEFLLQQDEWKRQVKEKQAEEELKLKEYFERQEMIKTLGNEKMKERNDKIERFRVNAANVLLTETLRKLELETARIELDAHEHAEKLRKKDEDAAASKQLYRQDLKKMFVDQLKLKDERLKQEKEMEEHYKKEALVKLAEEEKIEMLNATARHHKQLEYRKEVEELLQQRKAHYALRVEQEMAEWKALEKLEQEEREMVEAEARKMLEKHAKNLDGFLQANILNNILDKKVKIQPSD